MSGPLRAAAQGVEHQTVPSHDDLPERYPVLEHAERRRRELQQPWWNKRMSSTEVILCLLAAGVFVEWAYRPLF